MRRIAVLLICLMPVLLHAEDRAAIEDGTFWKALTPNEKTSFVMGYANGFNAGQSEFRGSLTMYKIKPTQTILDSAAENAPNNITFGTLVEGVDKCYSDFRNSRLDVETCIDWTVLGIKGDSDQVREEYLAFMRKAAD